LPQASPQFNEKLVKMDTIEQPTPPTRNRLGIWLLLVLSGALAMWAFPALIDPQSWGDTLRPMGATMWIALLALQCICALLMLPSLPLIVASTMLFPEQPERVLLLAIVGVLLSALMIYANAGFMGLRSQTPKRSVLRRARLWVRRHGSPALCLWCMTPFLPTDLACYVAASTKMPLNRYLPAILIGESVLCASVIYSVVGLIS